MRSFTGDLTHDLDPNSSDVAGMQYPPGLDTGDDSLDPVANLVDGPVVGLVVGVEGRVRGLSLRGDHVQSDGALVADM